MNYFNIFRIFREIKDQWTSSYLNKQMGFHFLDGRLDEGDVTDESLGAGELPMKFLRTQTIPGIRLLPPWSRLAPS